jgi:hypothetical protein
MVRQKSKDALVLILRACCTFSDDTVRVHCNGTLEDGTVTRSVIENLLMADWRARRDQPLTAEELLIIGRNAFEPLFHEPPIGPVPDYLAPHWSVHGCVAEYEEKLEELDRWKALELSRWLKDRIGKNWCVAGKVYELQAEQEAGGTPKKFWFQQIGMST